MYSNLFISNEVVFNKINSLYYTLDLKSEILKKLHKSLLEEERQFQVVLNL